MSWADIRLGYRREIRRVIDDIGQGKVADVDLDKLNNFCMVALTLMGKVPEAVWRRAERDAEIRGWINGEVVDVHPEPVVYPRA